MAPQRKWPGWYKATAEERLLRRKRQVAIVGVLLVGTFALSFARPIDVSWVWYLAGTVPFVASAAVQVIAGRENLWLDRFGLAISCAILAWGWHVTGIDVLLTVAAIMPFIAVLDIYLHRKWSGLHAR